MAKAHQNIHSNKVVEKIKSSRAVRETVDQLSNKVLQGDTNALSRAITLIESAHETDILKAEELLRMLLPHAGNSIRIGISGVPGAGKSTFIESYGMHLIQQGKKVAVLAVDPSSEAGKGSILGDKTRMNSLASQAKAFIRPSPSSGALGGVARKTREAIFLCEAAGFDHILVETVGVGQSETAVHSMVDFFLLIAIAGAGDELQGIKRGIMEMADLVVVNKADGDNLPKAKAARQDIQRALHFFPQLPSGWTPEAILASSIEATGMLEINEVIDRFTKHVNQNGYFQNHRKEQSKWWLKETIQHELNELFFNQQDVKNVLAQTEKEVIQQHLSVTEAARQLIQLFRNK